MLRNALLATVAGAPLVLLGCGEGLAGTGTSDGGSSADANFGPDGAAPTSDGATGPGMDATSTDAASPGHDSGGAATEAGSTPEAGGPDGSNGGSCGTCPSGQVCCEPPLGCAGTCVPDCRQGGSCPQGLTCDQNTGVCSPSGDGGMMPPPDGGMMPPPDGGMMPPPDGGMMPPPDGGMMPPPDGGMMPPPDGGSGSDAGDSSGAAPPGIGKIAGTGGVRPPIAGDNVSIDDTTIVLGDSGPACYNGHARVYVWDGVSSWQLQQELVDPDAMAMGGGYNFDCFGGAVAAKGDVAFVSSPVWGATSEGEVYEFTRSGTTWTQASTIVDSTFNGTVAYFGQSLAYDGTHLIAGAPALLNQNGTTYDGRVDVFTKGNMNWNLQKAIYAPVPAGSACFGTSVSMNGSRLAVGADGGPNGNYVKAGAAYSYTVSGSTWTYEAAAVGMDTQASDGFGESVALAAAGSQPDLLVVGAPAASPLASQSGAAYVFYLDGVSSQWVQNAKLVPSDGVASDQFGYAVGAISSTQVIIGAAGASKAYLFTFAGGQTWNQTTIYESCPTTIGWSMATWGTLAVTGKTDAVVLDTSLTNPGCGGN